MTARELLTRLQPEGLTATLKLRLEGGGEPSAELLELLRAHRDDLITHLALQLSDTPQMCRLSEEQEPEALWCRRCYRYHVKACVPSEKRFEDVAA